MGLKGRDLPRKVEFSYEHTVMQRGAAELSIAQKTFSFHIFQKKICKYCFKNLCPSAAERSAVAISADTYCNSQ